MTVAENEADIKVIKETLKWHGRVGWGIAGIYAVVFGGFLTWYLPKELDSQRAKLLVDLSSNIRTTVQQEVGKIPGAALQKLAVPTADITKLSPEQLQARFVRAKDIVNGSLANRLPSSPDLLPPVNNFIRAALASPSTKGETRSDGISALVSVESYEVFSKNAIANKSNVFFYHPTFKGSLSKSGWPISPGIAVKSPESVVIYGGSFTNLKQDITGIKWISTSFDGAVIYYNGGDVYFADVTFKNCKFVFGNDPRSQQLLNALKRSQGHATSILLAENASFLPDSP